MHAWEQLLAVQTLDTTIQQLDHRLAQLPERGELASITDELTALRAQVAAAEAGKHELVRGQKKLEDEVAGIEEKIGREEAQLYSGGSSDSGMLQALQDEIASLKRRISSLEDDEIELLELIEPFDAQLETYAATQAELDARAIAATTRLAEAESDISAARDVAVAERAALVAAIDAAVVTRYETVRARLGGVAVARLEPGGVCGACHMKLSAMEKDRIAHLPADEEVECEDCGRFLIRS